ncbi:hypothetical protein ACFVUY_38180 [Kitasatospora sp. NPDC058063]|uniref:hypothetical protein n=1 Tax=unclassified Kitasatospora TaxID=2633591 RepID=UPI0036D7FA7C
MTATTPNPDRISVAGPALRTVRIVARRGDGFALVAKVRCAGPNSPDDASLYISPYLGTGWTVRASSASVEPHTTINLPVQRSHPNAVAGDNAHLSLHHSGQTHAHVRQGDRVGPVFGPRLDDPAGGNIAVIECDDLRGLPSLDPREPASSSRFDLAVPGPGSDTAALRLALYSGASEQDLVDRIPYFSTAPLLRLERVGMPSPLVIGFRPLPVPGTPTPAPGVRISGGWGPGASADSPVSGVFLWAGPAS